MRANDDFEVFCPWDGAVITVVTGITAPGWFVVVHEDDDELHTFGVFVDAEITI